MSTDTYASNVEMNRRRSLIRAFEQPLHYRKLNTLRARYREPFLITENA